MSPQEFEAWWSELRVKVLPGSEVGHWSAESAAKGSVLSGSFEIFEIGPDYINLGWRTTIHKGMDAIRALEEGRTLAASDGLPSKRVVKVPAHVFRKSLARWNDYLAGEISRTQFETIATHQYSTYVIGILYWLETH